MYVEGDLAEYVTLNKDSLVGSGGVSASLALPIRIETPGTHVIYVGARQLPGEGGGIGIVGNIRGVIKVKVPYPGKYATVSFTTYLSREYKT